MILYILLIAAKLFYHGIFYNPVIKKFFIYKVKPGTVYISMYPEFPIFPAFAGQFAIVTAIFNPYIFRINSAGINVVMTDQLIDIKSLGFISSCLILCFPNEN